jgi:hypothetical protein
LLWQVGRLLHHDIGGCTLTVNIAKAATTLDGSDLVVLPLLVMHCPVAVLTCLLADVGSRAFPQHFFLSSFLVTTFEHVAYLVQVI